MPELSCDVLCFSRTAHCESVPKLLCPSVKSNWFLAALSTCLEFPNMAACTVITTLSRFVAGLTFKLLVHENTFITEFASRCFLVILRFGRMPEISRWLRALTFEVDSDLWDSFFSEIFRHLFLFAALKKVRMLVSVFHFDFHRGGNYKCLLLNTILLLSIDSIILFLVKHSCHPCDSVPLLLSRSSRFWPAKFRDLIFSSPWSSTSDDQV